MASNRAEDRGHCGEGLRAELLEAACAQGRAAWPEVAVDASTFGPYLVARLEPGLPVEEALAALRVTDLYLVCACVEGDRAAIRAMQGLIRETDPVLVRLEPSGGAREEIREHLRHQLLVGDRDEGPRLLQYRGRGDLKSWLKVSAVRRAQDHLRRERRTRALDDQAIMDIASQEEDQELAYLKRVYRAEFKAAFAEAFASLSAKERNLLRLQVVEGLTADEIGRIYRVHRITVVRWNGKVREKLFGATRASLMKRLRVGKTEFESIARMIQSQLDVSLYRKLRDPEDVSG